MPTSAPTHRSEQTGSPGLDRIQENVRGFIAFTKGIIARVLRIETQHGTAKLAVINLTGKTDVSVSEAQFACGYWSFVGVLSATCLFRVPHGTDSAVWERLAYNATSGGFSVEITDGDGTILLSPATGVHMLSTGTYGLESWV